jgi:hypothetical protein
VVPGLYERSFYARSVRWLPVSWIVRIRSAAHATSRKIR